MDFFGVLPPVERDRTAQPDLYSMPTVPVGALPANAPGHRRVGAGVLIPLQGSPI